MRGSECTEFGMSVVWRGAKQRQMIATVVCEMCLGAAKRNKAVIKLAVKHKLYGEVDGVKNTTINILINDDVYWQWKKFMFRLSAHIFRF